MRAPFRKFNLVWLVLLAFSTSSRSANRQVLNGHVPNVKSASVVGPLDATMQLDLAIALPLRHRPALTNLLHDLYDPASPSYHQYLTPAEFTEQFGPTADDYQAVIDFARTHHLTLRGTHQNRTLLDVSGSVSNVENAFHVLLRQYLHPAEARTYYAPDVEPSLDITNPVLMINGLNNYVIPQPGGHPSANPAAVSPGAGTGPNGNYLGQDFRKAYAPGVPLDGTGQIVALLELDGYYTNDIAAYRRLAGLPDITMTNILVDGATGEPKGSAGSIGEVSLDIEMVLAMAPGISRLDVYEAPDCCFYWVDILSRMASDNQARQISTSWLVGNNPSADQLYQQMAAQGQSFFQCAGDYGAFYQGISQFADSPYFTTVGATTLTTDKGASYASETAWSNYADDQGVQSTGGGISWNYPIPSWQQGINMSTNHGSAARRNIPDVAMVGDRIWVISDNGKSNWWWGTSLAAPLWAGFAAMMNQYAASTAQPPLGFINPALYALGKSSAYNSCFHDITTGNNTNSIVTTNFFATTGYDLCTGWGTPKGANLITALLPNNSPRITPLGGFTTAGALGGPFSTTAQSYTLSNNTSAPLSWTIADPSSWLTVSPTAGTVAARSKTNVVVTLNSHAYQLAAGTHTATVWFTNVNLHTAQSRQFVLQIGQPLAQNGGFETGDFSGWSLAGPLAANKISTNSLYAHSGIYGAQLGPPDELAYLSQSLPTLPGTLYLISCWLDSPDGETPNEFSISWNGTPLFDGTNLGALGWTNFQFLAVATSNVTTLQFGARNDPSAFGFDDVSVTPVPRPDFRSVVSSNEVVAFTWNTATGLHYQVQYNSSLTSSNWNDFGIQRKGIGSTLSATDTLTNGPRFYRIKLIP